MSPAEAGNMAKATRMRNAELAAALRTIARIQDDDALAKWVLGVAAERLENNFLAKNAAPASRELAPLDCKRPDQPGQAQLSSPNGGGIEAKLWNAMQLKADMFDYLCWLEDFCDFRQAALDGKTDDYLVLASDGTTCWGKTYAEAVRVAMEHDKEIFDATFSPNVDDEPHPEKSL